MQYLKRIKIERLSGCTMAAGKPAKRGNKKLYTLYEKGEQYGRK